MSTTPGLVWQNLRAVNASDTATAFQWDNPSLMAGNPPAVTMPHGDTLLAGVLTIGSSSTMYPFTASCAAGSYNFAVASGFSNLQPGMVVIGGTGILPNGLQILELNAPNSGSVLLGGFDGPPWGAGSVYTMPAGVTLTASTQLYAVDEYPYGALAVTTTPSTGVTIVDWNLDGGNVPGPIKGNGSAMSNSGGQAMGYFGVTFADAGTFTLEVAYTSTDPDYANTSSSTTVVVS